MKPKYSGDFFKLASSWTTNGDKSTDVFGISAHGELIIEIYGLEHVQRVQE